MALVDDVGYDPACANHMAASASMELELVWANPLTSRGHLMTNIRERKKRHEVNRTEAEHFFVTR